MTQAILLSGGMDSVALAAWKRPAHAITIDYGQIPAPGEIRAARKVSEVLGIQHHIIIIDCSSLGSGDMAGLPAIPAAPVSEWWPFRNQLLVTFGAMKAIALGANELLCGSVKTDAEHVDGTSPFYAEIDKLISMQEGAIRVCVPAIEFTTTQLIRASGVDLSLLAWCHSCHVNEYACGKCRGCRKRLGVLSELGYQDALIENS